MNLVDLAKKTGIQLDVLQGAANSLLIQGEELSRDDVIRLHTYLNNRPELKVPSGPLRMLGEIDPTTFTLDRKRVAFLGGSGFKPEFIIKRKDPVVEMQRKTRNCGDTAGLVIEGLDCQKITREVKRDKKRSELCDWLRGSATRHEVWQVTIHQHTFTIERCSLANWIVQSYQCSSGTYNVQFWCRLEDPFIDMQVTAVCGPIADNWYQPSNEQLQQLAKMINDLYDGDKKQRQANWAKLPFHPLDVGRVLEDSETLAFNAEQIILSGAKYAPCTVAGLEMVIFGAK